MVACRLDSGLAGEYLYDLDRLVICRKLSLAILNQYVKDLENVSSGGAYRVALPSFFRFASRHARMLPLFKKSIVHSQRMIGYAKQSLERYQSQCRSDPTTARHHCQHAGIHTLHRHPEIIREPISVRPSPMGESNKGHERRIHACTLAVAQELALLHDFCWRFPRCMYLLVKDYRARNGGIGLCIS